MNELKNKLASALNSSDFMNLGTLAEEAMQQYPNEGFGYYYFGEKLINDANADMPTAEWHFAKASFLEQSNITYLKKYAQSLVNQYKFEEAYNIWANIYHLDNSDDDALFGLGQYELEIKRNPQAAISFFASVSDPGADVYEGLALAYMMQEDFENALGYIDYALSIEFNVDRALSKISILESVQNSDLIPSVYEEILEIEPNNAGFIYEYARSLNKIKEYEDADKEYSKAFEILEATMTPESSVYRPYIENSLESGKFEKALSLADKCIQNEDKADVLLHEYKAAALAGTGNTDAALMEWDIIIGLYSFNPTLVLSAKLKKAELMANSGMKEEAENAYNKLENEIKSAQNPAVGLLRELYYGKALLALSNSNQKDAYFNANEAVKMGLEKAKDFIRTKLNIFLSESYQSVLAAHPSIENNAKNDNLKKVIAKAWNFTQLKINAPQEIAADADKKAAFDKSVEAFQDKLVEFAMAITEKEIYLDLPYSNPKKAVRNMVYIYDIEKEKDNLLQLNMYSVDGLDNLSAKLKIEGDHIVFSVVDGEVYKLSEISDIDKVSYRIQRNFYQHLGYLNPLKNFSPEGKSYNIIENLLDY